ncbi:VWA domain-containing protein [Pseudoprevotella muciniphila]|uniref:VWA domain-containing protein n=1 Tax=Pseudoprevotella muciniphila TaxID=2133944 RepID=A0A5P8E4Q6_9BACT|nr:VWA domain-containing protein [Pseudoprevotella muciniphila]QFQ11951.1 VWA domain-containing protein [Pseudoprevotella muciniphila]
MFRFANPEYLYALLLIPAFIVVWLLTLFAYRKRMKRFGERKLVHGLVEEYSRKRYITKFALMTSALAMIVLMMARPQFGMQTTKDTKKGIEAIFVVDVSNSMLARDVQPSRLEKAKILATTIIDRMQNDKVGLIVFAGEAYPQLPITNDLVSARMFLDAITTDMVSIQGTNLAAAISLANNSFTANKRVGKAIVVITDGENHEENALEAAKEAADDNRNVYVLGIGSTEGSPIPQGDGPMTDNNGQVVVTALNEEICKQVAKEGNGKYIHVDNSNNALQQLQNEIDKLQHDTAITAYDTYNEQFIAFAILALFFIVAEFLIFETKNPFYRKFRLFTK